MSPEEDDFVELAPRARNPPPTSPITFTTIALRGGVEKVSLSFSAEAMAKLEGWPRFAIAWSPKTMTLRIRADVSGLFEAFKSMKGGRYVLRTDLPAELLHVAQVKEPAPHRYAEDGKTIFVIAPPAFRRPPPKMSQADIIEAARRAVPAPKFGTR